MKVLSIKLLGFIGLRDGSGIESVDMDLSSLPEGLIAITGSNGSGKTTFLDNLHPYRIMPYKLRDRKDWSPGSFSFYDQCYGRDAMKELVFEMNRHIYRAQILIDAEKKKTDAYLFIKDGEEWKPLNDGKTKTFDAALENVIGSPRLFFSSAFRSQGARSLSSYSRGDIISIVSELLVIDHIKEQSDKAGEVVKWFDSQISTMNGTLDTIENQISNEPVLLERQSTAAAQITLNEKGIEVDRGIVTGIEEKIVLLKNRQATRKADEATSTGATKLHTSLTEALESEEKQLEEEGVKEKTDRNRIIDTALERIVEIADQKNSLSTDYTERNNGHSEEVDGLELNLKDLMAISDRREEITNASTKLVTLEESLIATEKTITRERESLEDSRNKSNELTEHETKRGLLKNDLEILKKSKVDSLERIQGNINDAEFISSKLKDLDCRADDTNWINEACPLLKNAVEAKESLVTLRKEHEEVTADDSLTEAKKKEINDIQLKIDKVFPHREAALTIFGKLKILENDVAECKDTIRDTKLTAALIHDLNHATERKIEIDKSIAILKEKVSNAKIKFDEETKALTEKAEKVDTEKEKELETLNTGWIAYQKKQSLVIDEHKKKVADQKEVCDKLTGLLTEDLAASLKNHEEERLAAETVITKREETLTELTSSKAVIESELETIDKAKNTRRSLKAQISSHKAEQTSWLVLRQACSNNGIIALEIDDAGPSIASMANKLLASCYGTRFSVRIETQGTKADGTLKEDFDITVFDSESGTDKSIKNMSGGEVTWIEDAITKAICLYRMERSDKVFDTIFTDEKDGALDEQKKNEFFSIKKQMLSIGHHNQEFFISQTPELQEQADAKIMIGNGEIKIKKAA